MKRTLFTNGRVYADGRFQETDLLVEDGRIAALEEYWGDDGPPPAWRQELHLGRPIR